MRDIVSEIGTVRSGLTALPTISATQHSPAISVATIGKYDGLMVDIMTSTASNAGTMTITLEVTDDNGSGSPTSNWTSIPSGDLVLWHATSTTDLTPVKVGNQQPIALSSTVTYDQRVGWFGIPQTFVDGSSVTRSLDWFRVTATVASSWSAPLDIVIFLGRPRKMPADF